MAKKCVIAPVPSIHLYYGLETYNLWKKVAFSINKDSYNMCDLFINLEIGTTIYIVPTQPENDRGNIYIDRKWYSSKYVGFQPPVNGFHPEPKYRPRSTLEQVEPGDPTIDTPAGGFWEVSNIELAPKKFSGNRPSYAHPFKCPF